MEKIQNSKITIFGDSIPKGIIFEDSQLKKLSDNVVSIIANKLHLNINNLSYYGQTLTRLEEKAIIDEYLIGINPDERNIAVISIGGNDSDFDWKKVASDPKVAHNPKTTPEDFETLLNSTITKLRKHNVEVILTNIPPVCSKKYFDNVISKTADKDKVLEFLQGDLDNIYRHQELYNLIITKCAHLNSCRLLDIRQAFLWDIKYLDSFCEDGIHPNHLGHIQMAENIIEQLRSI